MKGEFGYDTWENGSAEYTGNTGVWTQITVDEQLGLVYLPVESPTGDYYGGHRPGNDLFGETPGVRGSENRQAQVALPVGAPSAVGHGHFLRAAADGYQRERQADQSRRAAHQAGLPVRVRPRHRASRCGPSRRSRSSRAPSRASGIRPRSPSPPSRRPTRATASPRMNSIDFTPAIHEQAMDIVSHYHLGPVFTPARRKQTRRSVRDADARHRRRRNQLARRSFDPETHTVYAYACNACMTPIGLVQPPKEMSDMRYVAGTAGPSAHESRRSRRERRRRFARSLKVDPAAAAAAARGRRGGYMAAQRQWTPADQAALRHHFRHQSRSAAKSSGRSPMAILPITSQQPRAQRPQHPAHRPGQTTTSERWSPSRW